MKRLSAVTSRLRAGLGEHFELFLTAVGVFLTIMLVFSGLPRGELGLAQAFLIWLQGFLIWAVHRHATLRRKALIEKMAQLQRPDGSWAGDKRWMEDNPVLTTAYVVLALQEAQRDLKQHPPRR